MTSAAANRNENATLMFQNIACILDNAISEDHLPRHLQKPFREFVADLTSMARRHFDSHVRGTTRPPHPYSTPQPGSILPTNIVNPNVATFPPVPAVALPKRPSTYASVASAPHQPQQRQQSGRHPKPMLTQPLPPPRQRLLLSPEF
ncbi:hypothetical protein K3495_g12688 [Podosphaera aphanis]|nr:hypothetical protein K3495_g12688 [Podosphaera aphanis]